MEQQIRDINYDNPKLRQTIASNGNKTSLSLNGQNLTDQDMGIVADMLETNTVRIHCLFFKIYILLIRSQQSIS